MGSFFANLQAKLVHGARRRQLVEAVIEAVSGQGYELGETHTDRSVVIGPVRESGWVGVWDEASDDAASQRELAGKLGSCCDAVVSVLVHDGDSLHMELFGSGERRVSLDHGVDLVTGKFLEKARGPREPWLRLAGDETRADRLRAELDRGEVFGEEALQGVAEALGWHVRDAGTGYRYLLEGSHLDASEVSTLHFRLATRPSYETPMTGPPEFMKQGYTPELEPTKGGVLELHHSVSSMGGPGEGIDVMVHGPAVDAEVGGALFAPKRVRLWWGETQPGNELVAPMEIRKHDKGALWVAAFREFVIPAGLTDPYGAMAAPATMVKASKAFHARHVHVFIQGRVRRSGGGDLCVTVTPHANPRAGRARFRVRLRVKG